MISFALNGSYLLYDDGPWRCCQGRHAFKYGYFGWQRKMSEKQIVVHGPFCAHARTKRSL